MPKFHAQFKDGGNDLIPPPPFSSYSASSSSSQFGTKISPAVLLVIVILALVFFVSGILHLLVRYLMKRPSFYSSVSHSNRYPENPSNDAIQRQLQQLFRLHDSGLDQALIDALPVFYYKDIMGSKEPFDCAVCLCEFSDQDRLRLLPMCSHAFHIGCIDTWLLANSTCPLCRGSLLNSRLENQEFSLDHWRQLSLGCSINPQHNSSTGTSNAQSLNHCRPTIMEESARERRVFSIRLGKFKNLNDGENGETSTSASTNTSTSTSNSNSSISNSSSSSQIDGRRCYSLGTYQYVLADSNLQVALSTDVSRAENGGITLEKSVMAGQSGKNLVDGDVEGKKISRRDKRDSFSVSKIWLWSKKSRFPGSSGPNAHFGDPPCPLNVVLPLSSMDELP